MAFRSNSVGPDHDKSRAGCRHAVRRGWFAWRIPVLLVLGLSAAGPLALGEDADEDPGAANVAVDEVDARAPRDPMDRRLLDRVDYFLSREQWDEAYRLVVHLLAERRVPAGVSADIAGPQAPGGVLRRLPYLARTDAGHYLPAPRLVLEKLRSMPPRYRERFQQDFAPLAERWLRSGLENRDWSLLEHVAERFAPLQVGQRAAGILVLVYYDTGDLALAGYWAHHLLRQDSDVLQSPGIRHAAIAALHWLGEDAAAQRLAGPSDSPDGDAGGASAKGAAGGRADSGRFARPDVPGGDNDPLSDQPAAGADPAGSPHSDQAAAAGTAETQPAEPPRSGVSASGEPPAARRRRVMRPLPFGDVNGNDVAEGVAIPVLVPRWSVVTARTDTARRLLEELHEAVQNASPPVFPAWMPVCAGRLLAVPTPDGVVVLDRETGRRLYDLRDDVPAEAIINGHRLVHVGGLPAWLGAAPGTSSSSRLLSASRSPLSHPVSYFAWRNTVHSSIAFDPKGRRLYWIRGHAVLLGQRVVSSRQQSADASDPYSRDYDSNQLACVDAATGRTQWVVGGPVDAERLSGPLAGTCFLGPPVVVGRRAYVIGEKDQHLRLFELDAATGVLRWSVVLAQTSVPIGNDMMRRLLGLQPAINGGMVICPTHLGFVTAVNPRTQRVLWATRVVRMSPETANQNRGIAAQTFAPEVPGSEWLHARPIAVGGHVVVTPQEVSMKPVSVVNGRIVSYQTMRRALCLRLVDGKILWEKNKDDALCVAGVAGETVVVQQQRALAGWDLRSGKVLWSTGGGLSSHVPAGRVVVAPDRFALPTTDGAVVVGKPARADLRVVRPPSVAREPLGNLVAVGDLLVSVLPWRVDAFELADALQADLEAARRTKAVSPELQLRLAASALAAGRWKDAVERLRGLKPDDLAPEQRARRNWMLRVALERLVLDDPAAHAAETAELERLLQAEGKSVRLMRLQVERLLASGRLLEVWQRLVEAQTQWVGGSTPLPTEAEPSSSGLSWPPESWAEARARELWRKFSAQQKATAAQRLVSALESLKAPEDRLALARRFWFTEPGLEALRKHIEHSLASGRPGEAEAELAWLTAVLTDAPPWLAEQTRRAAEALAEKHAARLAHAAGPSEDAAAAGRGRPMPTEAAGADLPYWDWSGGEPEVQVRYGGYMPAPRVCFLPVLAEAGTYFDRHAVFAFRGNSPYSNSGAPVLRVIDLARGRIEWTRTLGRPAWVRSTTQAPDADAVGYRLFCYGNQVLRCLSPVEQRELWSAPIDAVQLDTIATRVQHEVVPLRAPSEAWFAASSAQPAGPGQFAWLMAVGPVVAVTAEPRGIVGRDSRTGAVRWSLPITGSYPACACWGNRVYVRYVPRNGASAGTRPPAAQAALPMARVSGVGMTRVLVLDGLTGQPLVAPQRVPFGAMAGRSQYLLTVGTPVPESRGAAPAVEPIGPDAAAGGNAGRPQAVPSSSRSGGTVASNSTSAGPVGSAAGAVVRLWDPISGQVAWSREVAANGKLAAVGRRLVLVADQRRGADVVDLTSGKTVRLRLPPGFRWDRSQVWVAGDGRHLYVFPEGTDPGNRRGLAEFPKSRPIGGTILAFAVTDGTLAWRYDGTPTWLSLRNLSISPVFVLARRETRMEHEVSYVLRTIELIDKRTGRLVWKQTRPVDRVPNLNGVTPDLADRWIELWSYRERIRISPRSAR